jgi:hypothetical protein
MAAELSDKEAQRLFRDWALDKIVNTDGHRLQCLVDPKTKKWYSNGVNFPNEPSIDAGHNMSKWTGGPQYLSIEDSDFNRTFNRGEGQSKGGVFFQKQSVSIDGVPVERRTALMLERTRSDKGQGGLKPGDVAAAPVVKGALYSPQKQTFVVEEMEKSSANSSTVPSIRSNVSIRGKIGELASNQDAVAMIGEWMGAGLTQLTYLGIAHQVDKQLKTTYADQIRAIHDNGNGVLVIVRVQSYAHPSSDYHGETPSLDYVSIQGGRHIEDAMEKWQNTPRIEAVAPQEFRFDYQYMWLSPPKKPR